MKISNVRIRQKATVTIKHQSKEINTLLGKKVADSLMKLTVMKEVISNLFVNNIILYLHS